MGHEIKQGQHVFYGDTLVGYIDHTQESDDGAQILHLRVPYLDLPPAQTIKTVDGKLITIKVGKPKKTFLTPSKVILDSLGRPIKVAKS